MKKTSLFIVAVAALFAASCKKERSCDCTVTSTTVFSSGSFSSTTSGTGSSKDTKAKDTKKNFRRDNNCYDFKNVTVTTSNGATTTDTDEYKCTIK